MARRNGGDSAATRKAILDAAQKIMRAEGYAAVTSRRVADEAGLRSLLVHYHFGTMDNLFLALFRRIEEKFLATHVRAIAAENPVRRLWEESLRGDTELVVQFIALAVHRKVIADELARSNNLVRTIHTAAIERAMEQAGGYPDDIPADVLAFLIAAITRTMVTEAALGASGVHPAVHAFVQSQLDRLEKRKT